MIGTDIQTYLASLARFGIKPGLQRMRFLVGRLGNPQLKFPSVLIGGTNGKGSVAEYIGSILVSAGYRTGVYTSPHIWCYNERIRVNGQMITDAELSETLNDILPDVDIARQTPELGEVTEFELLTLIAFVYFARKCVDVAVLEVGLGGRWDATNVAEPWVSVITHVALDHTDRLGSDVLSIAKEKIPIVRPNGVFVTAEQNAAVREMFESFCSDVGCAMLCRGRDFDAQILREWPEGIEVCVTTPHHRFAHLHSHLPGSFQAENIALAVVAAEALADQSRVHAAETGFRQLCVPPDCIGQGIGNARLPGRLQIVRKDPLVILDGANNAEGAAHLADNLRRHYAGRQITLVIGISEDKDVETIVTHLAPVASRLIATQADHWRAAPAERIIRAASVHAGVRTRVVLPVAGAVEVAIREAAPEDVICITGSFYVLGEVVL